MRGWAILLIVFFYFTCSGQSPNLVLPIGFTSDIIDVNITSDDQLLVVSGMQNSMFIWDAQSYQLLKTIKWTDKQVKYNELPLLSTVNGDLFVTHSGRRLSLWDIRSGIVLYSKDFLNSITSIKFSPDAKSLLCVLGDTTVLIIDTKSGAQLTKINQHGIIVSSAFSLDGQKLLTNSDSFANIWDTNNGYLLSSFKIGIHNQYRAAFSSNGERIIIGGSWPYRVDVYDVLKKTLIYKLVDDTVIVDDNQFYSRNEIYKSKNVDLQLSTRDSSCWFWAKNGVLLKKVTFPHSISGVGFYSDGSIVVLTHGDIVEFINLNSLELLKSIKYSANFTFSPIIFSRDGKRFITYTDDFQVQVWDAPRMVLLRTLHGHSNPIVALTNETIFAKVPSDSLINIWTLENTTLSGLLKGSLRSVSASSNVFDDSLLVVSYGNENYTNVIWNTKTLDKKLTFDRGDWRFIPQNYVSNAKVAYYNDSGSVEVRNIDTGAVVFVSNGGKGYHSWGPCLSKDGSKVCFDSSNIIIKIVEMKNNRTILRLNTVSRFVSGGTFSKDSKYFAITYFDSTADIWDIEKGEIIRKFKGRRCFRYPDFSRDGKSILFQHVLPIFEGGDFRGGLADSGVELCSIGSSKSVCTISTDGTTYPIQAHFLQNENIVRIFYGNTAKFADGEAGSNLLILHGETGNIISSAHSFDRKYIYTASDDNTIRKWNSSGDLLYTILMIDSSDYLIYDKYYRYDGTPGARKLLYFTCGSEIISLNQLKDQLWVPGLRQRIDSGEAINAKKLADLDICGVTPLVEQIGESLANQYKYRVTPRRGGLGTTTLYVNGIETKRYKPQELKKRNGSYELLISEADISDYLQNGIENKITLKAYTEKNEIGSRGVDIELDSTIKNVAPPDLYAVIIGVSEYKDAELHLQYAAKDAGDLSASLKVSAGKLLGDEHVFTYNLTTDKVHYLLPEKEGIHNVLEAIGKKAKANDILLIFFAGHGVMEKKSNQFYFLTADASKASATDALPDVGISAQELADWIQPARVKAQKRILILDACNSGQAINNMVQIGNGSQNYVAVRDDEKAQQIKAIDKLNEKSGLFILAASASNQSAYEMGRYSQGLLTYALLKAIKQQPEILEENKYLSVSRWFGAAEKTVSEIAINNGTRQQPQIVSAGNFNIGVVDGQVRSSIHLGEEKPLFGPCNFQNNDPAIADDDLSFNAILNRKLTDMATRGSDATIIYIGNASLSDAWTLSGRYTVIDDTITATVNMRQKGELKLRFEVNGKKSDLNGLALNILEKALATLR